VFTGKAEGSIGVEIAGKMNVFDRLSVGAKDTIHLYSWRFKLEYRNKPCEKIKVWRTDKMTTYCCELSFDEAVHDQR